MHDFNEQPYIEDVNYAAHFSNTINHLLGGSFIFGADIIHMESDLNLLIDLFSKIFSRISYYLKASVHLIVCIAPYPYRRWLFELKPLQIHEQKLWWVTELAW